MSKKSVPLEIADTIEQLLFEQLEKLGEDVSSFNSHTISKYMHCKIYPDQSMVYSWKDFPILKVFSEKTPTGIFWRIFTSEEYDNNVR